MKTKRQEELIATFLSALDDDIRPVYQRLVAYLANLGYNPQKEKSSVSFKHDAHNKQIAKIRMAKNGPCFALRFSACRGYSKRFDEAVSAWMTKYPTRAARCPSGGCGYCRGEPDTHVYAHNIDGEYKLHCGAYAVEIPDLSEGDVEEIEALIRQEHAYLMKHEAGVAL